MNTTERLIANRERVRCIVELARGLADPVIAHAELVDAIDIALVNYRGALVSEIERREKQST